MQVSPGSKIIPPSKVPTRDSAQWTPTYYTFATLSARLTRVSVFSLLLVGLFGDWFGSVVGIVKHFKLFRRFSFGCSTGKAPVISLHRFIVNPILCK